MTTLNSRIEALEQSQVAAADWHPTVHLIERDWNESDEAAKARYGIDPQFPDVTLIVVSRENH